MFMDRLWPGARLFFLRTFNRDARARFAPVSNQQFPSEFDSGESGDPFVRWRTERKPAALQDFQYFLQDAGELGLAAQRKPWFDISSPRREQRNRPKVLEAW